MHGTGVAPPCPLTVGFKPRLDPGLRSVWPRRDSSRNTCRHRLCLRRPVATVPMTTVSVATVPLAKVPAATAEVGGAQLQAQDIVMTNEGNLGVCCRGLRSPVSALRSRSSHSDIEGYSVRHRRSIPPTGSKRCCEGGFVW